MIQTFFDEGTFAEQLNSDEYLVDHVIVGSGSVNGRRVYMIADSEQETLPADLSLLKRKKTKFIELIRRDPAPVVFLLANVVTRSVFARAGLVIPPGMTRMLVGRDGLGAYLSALAQLSGIAPTVPVVCGNPIAGFVFTAGLCDTCIL